jgi:hypothetical protein
VELCLHTSKMPSWGGAQLKHRANFTFTQSIKSLVVKPIGLVTNRHVKKVLSIWAFTFDFLSTEHESVLIVNRLNIQTTGVMWKRNAPCKDTLALS